MAPFLRRLWVGMLTRNEEDSGTDSQIALTVTEDGADRLYHLFPDTSQNDQERGQPNLYEVPEELVLSAKISPERFVVAGVDIRGNDAWQPEVVFVWGERLGDGAIIPLALNLKPDFTPENQRVTLSTDLDEGVARMALQSVRVGSLQTRIESLLLLINTSSADDSGTDDRLGLRVFPTGFPSVLTSRVPFPDDTSQEDLETGLPNLYEIRVGVPGPFFPAFTRAQLAPNSIRLIIEGDDAWLPSSIFMFGLDSHSFANRPVREVVPLVHLPTWNLSPLSTALNEGRSEVVLPLVPLLPINPPVPSPATSMVPSAVLSQTVPR
jgi:hypothetical protein